MNDKSARRKTDESECTERSLIAEWRAVGRLDVATDASRLPTLDGLRTEPVEVCP